MSSLVTQDRGQVDVSQANGDLQRTALLLDFARFGFTGTLAAGLSGMGLILGLALLEAFTKFHIDTWGLVAIALIVLAGGVAFGYFSLRKLPAVALKISEMSVGIDTPSPRATKPATKSV